MFQLSEYGRGIIEDWNRSANSELLCLLCDDKSPALYSCPQHCSDSLFCSYHRAPARHSCEGCAAVLLEDGSEDLPFVLHMPQDQSSPEILSLLTIAEQMDSSLAIGSRAVAKDGPSREVAGTSVPCVDGVPLVDSQSVSPRSVPGPSGRDAGEGLAESAPVPLWENVAFNPRPSFEDISARVQEKGRFYTVGDPESWARVSPRSLFERARDQFKAWETLLNSPEAAAVEAARIHRHWESPAGDPVLPSFCDGHSTDGSTTDLEYMHPWDEADTDMDGPLAKGSRRRGRRDPRTGG